LNTIRRAYGIERRRIVLSVTSRRRLPKSRLACSQKANVGFVAASMPPIDIRELTERGARLRIIEAQGNKPKFAIEGISEAEGLALHGSPIGAEGVGRHAKDKDTGSLQALIDLARDAVTRPDLPLVEPDLQAILSQALGKAAHHGLVFGTVAEEHIVGETVSSHAVTVLS